MEPFCQKLTFILYITKQSNKNEKRTFSGHFLKKLVTNLKGKVSKHSNSWRLNSMLLNNEWVKNEIREEIKKFLETNKNELTTIQNYGT